MVVPFKRETIIGIFYYEIFRKKLANLENRLLINLEVITQPLDNNKVSFVKYLNWSKLEIQLVPVKFHSSDS